MDIEDDDGFGYFIAKKDKAGDVIVIGLNGQIGSSEKWKPTIPANRIRDFSGFADPGDPVLSLQFRDDILEGDSFDELLGLQFNARTNKTFELNGNVYGVGDRTFITDNFQKL